MFAVGSARDAQLMDLARIGATPKSGASRLMSTELDGLSRNQSVFWARAAGCNVLLNVMMRDGGVASVAASTEQITIGAEP